MKRPLHTTALALSLALATASASIAAQEISVNWNPRSGDIWVDEQLSDMNSYGLRYRDSFIDEMVRYYSAPRALVTDLLVRQRWAPGDVYYACAIGQVIGRPCQYVVEEWNRSRGEGWGVVAQRMGIKPGSAEFHRLKRGFVPTYDRWSRPIRLDDELQRHFPNRGNAGNPGNRGHGQPANAGNRGQGQNNGNPRGNRGQGNNNPNRGQDNPGRGG